MASSGTIAPSGAAGARVWGDDERVVREHIATRVHEVMLAGSGMLTHPYIVPGGYYKQLW